MSSLTKRAAAQLVADIRNAHITGRAVALRAGGASHEAMAGFLGGLESVLQAFLRQQGCPEAAAALPKAMNAPVTDAELAAREARLGPRPKPTQPHQCRMPDGRCSMCGGDWAVCGCQGFFNREFQRRAA